MSLATLNVTENYDALKILRESHLNTAMQTIEDWTVLNNNDLTQLALDVFGTYTFNNDGLQSVATPLDQAVAKTADNETITGGWTFSNTVSFGNVVSSTSTFSSSGQMRAKAYLATANQSIADVTSTAVAFNAESYDVGTMHDNTVNNSRISIPSGGSGIYTFTAQVTFDANATGRREVAIYKNGSEIAKSIAVSASASFDLPVQVTVDDTTAVNDYYEVYVYQNSGGALDIVLGSTITFFSAIKVW